MMKVRSMVFLCLSFLSTVCAGAAHAANPLGIAFKYTTNVTRYAKPTGIVITGRCNRYSSDFAKVRAGGGEVLAYLAPAIRPDQWVCDLDKQFYMNNYSAVPLWPWPSYGKRTMWPGSKMTDMRPGSKWILFMVSYVEKLMREGKVDGVFLDNIGGRAWGSLANWDSWSTTEKNAWTDGSIDLVRRLDAKRRAIKPSFLIINNNVWYRSDKRGDPGEKYVDGVALEHPALWLSAWHRNYAARPFGNLGQRRLLVIARSTAEARAWTGVKGVTHVSDQVTYSYPTVPPVGFSALNDR